jgi:hypothetical protein
MIETRQILMIPGLCSDAAIWRRTITALGSDFRCIVGDTLQDPTLPLMARRILDGAPEKFALAGVSYGSVRGARGNSRPYRESDRRIGKPTRLTQGGHSRVMRLRCWGPAT